MGLVMRKFDEVDIISFDGVSTIRVVQWRMLVRIFDQKFWIPHNPWWCQGLGMGASPLLSFFWTFLWQPKSLLVSSKWRAKRKHYKVLCICVLGKDKIGITCSCWVSIPNQIKQHELHLLEDGTGHWARNRRLSLINLAQLIDLLIIIDNLSTWLIDLVIWYWARKVV